MTISAGWASTGGRLFSRVGKTLTNTIILIAQQDLSHKMRCYSPRDEEPEMSTWSSTERVGSMTTSRTKSPLHLSNFLGNPRSNFTTRFIKQNEILLYVDWWPDPLNMVLNREFVLVENFTTCVITCLCALFNFGCCLLCTNELITFNHCGLWGALRAPHIKLLCTTPSLSFSQTIITFYQYTKVFRDKSSKWPQ